ncbi:hypothetical protein OSTOST_12828, partial [Ostertagia ostertagi]
RGTTSRSKVACILLAVFINVNCITTSGGETRWQLFNQCSKAMLQTYLGHINTRGESSRLCLTDFNVKVNRLGMFQLQHAQSRKYVCFNRRKRVTVRVSELGLSFDLSAYEFLIIGFINTVYALRREKQHIKVVQVVLKKTTKNVVEKADNNDSDPTAR